MSSLKIKDFFTGGRNKRRGSAAAAENVADRQLLGTDEQSQPLPLTISTKVDSRSSSSASAAATTTSVASISNEGENFTSAFKMMKDQYQQSQQQQQQKILGRVFGKVLQSSRPNSRSGADVPGNAAGAIMSSAEKSFSYASSSGVDSNRRTSYKPNPNERLWNPSPSKRPKNVQERKKNAKKDFASKEHHLDKGSRRKSSNRHASDELDAKKVSSFDKENTNQTTSTSATQGWSWLDTDTQLPGLSSSAAAGIPTSFTSACFPKAIKNDDGIIIKSVASNQLSLPGQHQARASSNGTFTSALRLSLVAPSSSSDLNNSFTEKISNLDLSGLASETITAAASKSKETRNDKDDKSSLLNLESNSILSASTVLGPNDSQNNKENEKPALVKNNKKESKTFGNERLPLQPKLGGGDYWFEQLDPTNVYITEILNYWHKLETEITVDPNYMEKQKEISYKMRTILIDWIVEVAEEYSIANPTVHRAVHFLDRFLSKWQISRGNLQLLGTACLFIACKVEEVQPPETGDLVYITDNTYSKAQLLHMECCVLSVLDFDLLTPTAYDFTEYFVSTLYLNPTAKEFSFYAVELTLLRGEKFLSFCPSIIGIAGAYVGIRCCGDSGWHYAMSSLGKSIKNYCSAFGNRSSSKNPDESSSVASIISRIKRLNPHPEFVKKVEEAVALMFQALLSVSGCSSGNDNNGSICSGSNVSSNNANESTSNSVCNKYKMFQDQRYFVAAASAAACFPTPPQWHDSIFKS